ncbi:MAG TPA: hypothetical protein IAB55_07440 [Candidatus Merdivicinus faecavium]|nr:hypothetical protein [Candidatus Merdivicinus faecavium]
MYNECNRRHSGSSMCRGRKGLQPAFALTEGDGPDFSYVINGADDCYLLMEGVWYAVSNPVSPPVGE